MVFCCGGSPEGNPLVWRRALAGSYRSRNLGKTRKMSCQRARECCPQVCLQSVIENNKRSQNNLHNPQTYYRHGDSGDSRRFVRLAAIVEQPNERTPPSATPPPFSSTLNTLAMRIYELPVYGSTTTTAKDNEGCLAFWSLWPQQFCSAAV